MSRLSRKRAALLAGLVLTAAGCSTISSTVDTLNPFSKSAPKIKPAELATIQPTAELRSLWQASIGSAGEFAFTPAVVGESVYVAARDGTLARFDAGRQVWRVSAGTVISGGVGADGKLVVVGSPKGEVLAFHAADGSPAWQTRTSSEILAAPAVSGDLVAVRSGDARIFGFDAADGKRRWVYQRSTPALALRSNVGVVLTDRALYAGFPGGKLVAVALQQWCGAVGVDRRPAAWLDGTGTHYRCGQRSGCPRSQCLCRCLSGAGGLFRCREWQPAMDARCVVHQRSGHRQSLPLCQRRERYGAGVRSQQRCQYLEAGQTFHAQFVAPAGRGSPCRRRRLSGRGAFAVRRRWFLCRAPDDRWLAPSLPRRAAWARTSSYKPRTVQCKR